MKALVFLAVLFAVAVTCERADFTGHRLYALSLDSPTHLTQLKTILSSDLTLDLWSSLTKTDNSNVLIRVPPESNRKFLRSITRSGITHKVVNDNVQNLIDDEQRSPTDDLLDSTDSQIVFVGNGVTSVPEIPKGYQRYFKSYHPYNEIVEFMDGLHNAYPALVEKFQLGKTYEGRVQHGIKISGNSTAETKQVVFFAGEHAREWIGPATLQYLAISLLNSYSDDPSILDKYTFHIIPVLNVDGYIFSHERNRMWRKNRQPTRIPFCVGTDINRNWGYMWGEDGASSNPCSDAFAGQYAFSSPEAKNLKEYTSTLDNLEIWIDFHAFSQLWMYPYGAECDKAAKNEKDLKGAGIAATSALKKLYGTSFAVGSICNIIYQASGSSTDWAYEALGVKYSYGVELRDTGRHGFILPPEQIIPSGREVVAAVSGLLEYINATKPWHL